MTEDAWYNAVQSPKAWQHILSKILATANKTYSNKKELAADIGSCLWWIVHNVRWSRGTSSISESITQSLWIMHNHAPPPTAPYDCIALTMDESEFVSWFVTRFGD